MTRALDSCLQCPLPFIDVSLCCACSIVAFFMVKRQAVNNLGVYDLYVGNHQTPQSTVGADLSQPTPDLSGRPGRVISRYFVTSHYRLVPVAFWDIDRLLCFFPTNSGRERERGDTRPPGRRFQEEDKGV